MEFFVTVDGAEMGVIVADTLFEACEHLPLEWDHITITRWG